jgi:predicted nucleic acid-binding protein
MDTSTLVAAMLPEHPDHTHAHHWLSRAKAGAFQLSVSAHSCAELFAVLTRLPRTPMITADEARTLLRDNVLAIAEIVALAPVDYVAMIEQAADQGIIGGSIYDAIIAKAAELAVVDRLVTLNVNDFVRVWPGHGGRITSPTALAPP